MEVFNRNNLASNAPLFNYNSHFLNPSNINVDSKNSYEQNKYFAFDKSIHSTLAAFNRISRENLLSLSTLHDLFKANWVSSGYQSTSEEKEFFTKGLSMLSCYFDNRRDQGEDALIVNKVLSMQIQNKIHISTWARIDKVIEYDNSIEIIDYKSGKNINHTDNFALDLRSIVYALLIHNKFGTVPIYISYYYLSCNKKYTTIITEGDVPKLYDYLYKLVILYKRY